MIQFAIFVLTYAFMVFLFIAAIVAKFKSRP